jgi:hypothetical protein
MSKPYSNTCTRCGSERTVSKVTIEMIGTSKIVCTQKICPNPECQQKVDKENKIQTDKRNELKRQSEERSLKRKAEKASMPKTTK